MGWGKIVAILKSGYVVRISCGFAPASVLLLHGSVNGILLFNT